MLLWLKDLVALLLHQVHRWLDQGLPEPVLLFARETLYILLFSLLMPHPNRIAAPLLLKHAIVNIIVELRGSHGSVVIHVGLEVSRVLLLADLRVLDGLPCHSGVYLLSRLLLQLVSTAIARDVPLDVNLACMHLLVAVLDDFFPRNPKNLWLKLLAVVSTGA